MRVKRPEFGEAQSTPAQLLAPAVLSEPRVDFPLQDLTTCPLDLDVAPDRTLLPASANGAIATVRSARAASAVIIVRIIVRHSSSGKA